MVSCYLDSQLSASGVDEGAGRPFSRGGCRGQLITLIPPSESLVVICVDKINQGRILADLGDCRYISQLVPIYMSSSYSLLPPELRKGGSYRNHTQPIVKAEVSVSIFVSNTGSRLAGERLPIPIAVG